MNENRDRAFLSGRPDTPLLGVFCVNTSPELVELVGHLGLDFVIIDHMFTATDWNTTAHLIRAAERSGLSTFVRVNASPWSSQGADYAMGAEMGRAQALGALGAIASVGSVEEVERALVIRHDYLHRRVWINPIASEDWVHAANRTDEYHPEYGLVPGGVKDFLVCPLIETPEIAAQAHRMLDLDGIRMVFLASDDLARSFGHGYDFDYDDIWRYVEGFTTAAHEKDVLVVGNLGRTCRSPEQTVARVAKLWKHGVDVIALDTPEMMLQYALEGILTGIRRELA